MKKLISTIMLVFLISLGIFSQKTENEGKLDQLALMKQFEGSWEGVVGIDSVCKFTLTLPGKGGECDFEYSTKGKIYLKGKQLWGYNPKEDLIIIVQMSNYRWANMWKMKFVTAKEVNSNFYFIENPKESKAEWKMEFITSNELRQTLLSGNKNIVINYKRIK